MNGCFYFFRCTVIGLKVWNFKNLVGVFLCMCRPLAVLEGFLKLPKSLMQTWNIRM